MQIAMWSGPRNLSTAMMYAFDARPDCVGVDEPFYAAYLAASGADHPMRDAVLASQPTDPEVVARACATPPATGHVYQKHMTHHMLPGMPRDWFDAVTHVFLIRHPARVIASYHAKNQNPTLADLGFVQQREIYDDLAARGVSPIVIDSTQIRRAPEPSLRALCAALGLGFDPAMLRWPAGPRACDGVWAAHWYGAVHRSTAIAGEEPPPPDLPGHLRPLLDAALPFYEHLAAAAIDPR